MFRHQVSTVAADVCCKIVEARTASVVVVPHPGGGAGGGGGGGGAPSGSTAGSDSIWRDASRALAQQFPRFDALDKGRPVTSSGERALAQQFPRFDALVKGRPVTSSCAEGCGRGAPLNL